MTSKSLFRFIPSHRNRPSGRVLPSGAIALFLMASVLSACVEATFVGNDLLEPDLQVVGFVDTLRLRARVVTEDSILVHSENSGGQIGRHCIGNLDDPFFGKASSVVSSQVFLATDVPAFLEFDVDSVVIQLMYQDGGHYGRFDEPLTMEVLRVSEPLVPTQDYYSNRDVATTGEVIARIENFVPNFTDSIVVERPGDTTILDPHIRIPVSEAFITELITQPQSTYTNNDSLQSWLNGLQFRLTGGENTMLSFNLDDLESGMMIYYSDADTALFNRFRILFTSLSVFARTPVQLAKFEHDYTGSEVEKFIGDTDLTDSLIFLQSLSGVNTEFEIVGLAQTEDIIINQAILELYTAVLPGNDTAWYPFIDRVQTKVLDDEGTLVNSPDVILALQFQNINAFGGLGADAGPAGTRYSMNITANVQDILQGRAENKIFISSYLKQNQPDRMILYGPGHSLYPARLKITFTRTTN